MKEDQKGIYYITGEKEVILRNSPLLEAYKKRDIEVLIMDDDIDEIRCPQYWAIRGGRSQGGE
jgi:molecular chaperone HtpG